MGIVEIPGPGEPSWKNAEIKSEGRDLNPTEDVNFSIPTDPSKLIIDKYVGLDFEKI